MNEKNIVAILKGEVYRYERYDNNAGNDRDKIISRTGNTIR